MYLINDNHRGVPCVPGVLDYRVIPCLLTGIINLNFFIIKGVKNVKRWCKTGCRQEKER